MVHNWLSDHVPVRVCRGRFSCVVYLRKATMTPLHLSLLRQLAWPIAAARMTAQEARKRTGTRTLTIKTKSKSPIRSTVSVPVATAIPAVVHRTLPTNINIYSPPHPEGPTSSSSFSSVSPPNVMVLKLYLALWLHLQSHQVQAT